MDVASAALSRAPRQPDRRRTNASLAPLPFLEPGPARPGHVRPVVTTRRRPRPVLISALTLLTVATASAETPLRAQSSQQNSPNASTASDVVSKGVSVNNETNLQINTLPFTGFGPGINCPTPSLTAGLFSVQGSGSSTAAPNGDGQSYTSVGGLVKLNLPIGGTDARTCAELGRSRVRLLEGQIDSLRNETAQLQADTSWEIASRCVEALREARLAGVYARLCQGLALRATSPAPDEPILQRFDP